MEVEISYVVWLSLHCNHKKSWHGFAFSSVSRILSSDSWLAFPCSTKKPNTANQATLTLVYGKNALCQRIVDTWAARFRSGRTSVEDDDRSGRPSSANLSTAISGYLNRNPHASCREIAKDLFIPKTTILRVMDKMSLRFFVARWVP
jgi:hypothetical protein